MKLGQGQWQETGSRLLSVYTFAPATAAARILVCIRNIHSSLANARKFNRVLCAIFSCCSRTKKV